MEVEESGHVKYYFGIYCILSVSEFDRITDSFNKWSLRRELSVEVPCTREDKHVEYSKGGGCRRIQNTFSHYNLRMMSNGPTLLRVL